MDFKIKPRIRILQCEFDGPFHRVAQFDGFRKASDGYHHTHSIGVKMRHGTGDWERYRKAKAKAFQTIFTNMARAG